MKELEEIALTARRILQEALLRCMNKENTKGACLYGAHLVHTMVSQFTQHTSVVRGGDGRGDGGFYIDGVGHGHYWVEVKAPSGLIIIDITADQFGIEPIIVKPSKDIGFYFNGNQELVDQHYGEFMVDIGSVVPCSFMSVN